MNYRQLLVSCFLSMAAFCLDNEGTCAQPKSEFSNPILAGFHPDPSICKVGRDYFLVNSSFSYFPGLPVFHSADLANWKLVGHVLDRPEQLNLDKQGVSRGLFAPAIRYNKGVFYVTCTLVDIGGNFVVTSKSPEGPWSSPIWLPQINGIDPSPFFDDNGKAYILYNGVAPDDKPTYEGHRTIRMYEFDASGLKLVGSEHLLINGGTDLSKKPIWIEGPHIFKKDGYYFLICAEGGTGEQHSEVVFRSANVEGPYVSFEKNPILTQRHLNPKRPNPITSTGHADFIQTDSGDWWAVFLGCRPYPPAEENYYNTGRETFLAPVRWVNGWPIINPGYEEVQFHYPYPIRPVKKLSAFSYSGNFDNIDEFNSRVLNLNWVYLRTPHEKWYNLNAKSGFLAMKLRPETCSGNMNPSFLGHRQQHLNSAASAAMEFTPKGENEKAGILIFQNETHFYFLCKSLTGAHPVIQLCRSSGGDDSRKQLEVMASQRITKAQKTKQLNLKIEARGNTYSFSYGFAADKWVLLKDSVDGKFVSTRVAGGFVGCMYALYSTSLGELTTNTAYFDRFEYRGNDAVYK